MMNYQNKKLYMTENNLIDISVQISPKIPIWPETTTPKIRVIKNVEKDGVNVSSISMNVHTGTHIDSPLHFVKNGKTIEKLNIEALTGRCLVVNLEGVQLITKEIIKRKIDNKIVNKLLFKTDNSKLWSRTDEFYKDYVGLSECAAKWVVEKGIELVGIDYLSIQAFKQPDKVHITLLENEVIILEGLNLENVVEGEYILYAFPINIQNVEGAPVRAVLKKLK